MTVELRPAEEKDLTALLDFSRHTFHAAYAHLNAPEDFAAYMKNAFNENRIKNEHANPGSHFWLAEIEEKIVGYIKVNFGEAQTDLYTDDGMEVERIYVSPEKQGHGIGKILMEKAMEIASEADMKYVWLGVWDKNPKAIKFYAREGFEEFGKHVFQIGSDAQTDILMQRFI